MVNETIGILALPQKEINRQFYEMLVKAEAGDASAIKALADKIGDESTANTILKRIKDIETGIGKASGTGAGGILKDIKDINDKIGDPTDPAEGTIEARLYALEHPAQNEGTG